jgi:hypothetical protein
LRVELRVGIPRAVERNGLVAEDVIASFERRRDCYGACSAANNAVSGPSLVAEIASFSNFDEFESGLLRPCAIAVAWSYEGKDRTLVRIRPYIFG